MKNWMVWTLFLLGASCSTSPGSDDMGTMQDLDARMSDLDIADVLDSDTSSDMSDMEVDAEMTPRFDVVYGDVESPDSCENICMGAGAVCNPNIPTGRLGPMNAVYAKPDTMMRDGALIGPCDQVPDKMLNDLVLFNLFCLCDFE